MKNMPYKPLIDVSKLPEPPGPRDPKGGARPYSSTMVWYIVGVIAVLGLLYGAFTLGRLI